jgi:DNA-binding NarL/FixJ family response regulator
MNILLAHRRTLFRDSLKHVLMDLERDVAFLETDNWTHLLSQADGIAEINLGLIELDLPGARLPAGVAQLIERRPALPVVIVAPVVTPEQVVGALVEGARGFVPETIPAPVLVQALRLVLVGGTYVPVGCYERSDKSSRLPGVAQSVGPHAWKIDPDGGTALTARQAQVLKLLSQGKPNKLIARELGLAESTVKCHVATVLKTLNVRNRTSAAMAASRFIGSVLADRHTPQGSLTH